MRELSLLRSVFQGKQRIFLLILLCFFVVLFIRIRLISVFVNNVGGIEQNVIYSCQRVATGLPLYTNPAEPPYSFTQYSPFYFYLVGYAGKAAGIDPADPIGWFRLSRLFSLILNLLLLLVCYRILCMLNPDLWQLNLGLSMLLFLFFEQQDYSRPDSLYHLFFGLAVLFFLRFLKDYPVRHPHRTLALAAALTALALFSKQSGIFFAGFSLLVLVFRYPLRSAVLYSVAFLTTVLILMLLLPQTKASHLYMNLFLGILSGFDLKWAIKLYFLPSLPRFMVFFLTTAMLLLSWKNLSPGIPRILTTASLTYLGIALLSGARWGSGTNYFFEFCLLTTLAFPFIYRHYFQDSDPVFRRKLALSVLIAMILPQLAIIAWRDYYKSNPDQYYQEKMLASVLRSRPELAGMPLVVPDQTWMNHFFIDRSWFPQPDIYHRMYDKEEGDPLINPVFPESGKILVIRQNPEPPRAVFHLALTSARPVTSSGRITVFSCDH